MIDKNSLEKIKKVIKDGRAKEEIYVALINHGWKVNDINEYFVEIDHEKQEEHRKENLQKRTVSIIAIIGAILIGAGIFSFVASNWQHMPKLLKILILLITMLFAYTGGWFLKEKYNFKKLGEALLLLGLITYGASIFLTAQMFNVRANWPDGFILWMFGSIALTLATDIFLFNYLTVILGVISFIGHPIVIFDRFSSHDPFLLTSSFLLLVSTITLFLIAFFIRKKVKISEEEYY